MGTKLRKVERRTKQIHLFFLPRRSNFAKLLAKLRKNEKNAKEKLAKDVKNVNFESCIVNYSVPLSSDSRRLHVGAAFDYD